MSVLVTVEPTAIGMMKMVMTIIGPSNRRTPIVIKLECFPITTAMRLIILTNMKLRIKIMNLLFASSSSSFLFFLFYYFISTRNKPDV